MSDVRPDVDLSALARKEVARPPRRPLRWLVPLLLIGGCAAVLLSTLTDLWQGARVVTVVRPAPADAAAAGGELMRSGWIEPDPYAIQVPALVPGVVKELLVLESASVRAGDPVARLVDDAAKLELAAAAAALARTQAEVTAAEVELTNARASFEAALDLTEMEATARAESAGRAAEVRHRTAAARQGQAAVRVAEEELALARYLAENGAAGPRQVELAEAKAESERAALAVLEADAALAQAEAEKATARTTRVQRERELRLADRLRVATAEADLALAQATALEAAAARDQAALRLERTTLRAPADGVVLARLAAPGALVGTEGAAPVVTLYDPAHLRVRVDVEQSEVSKLAVGQKARVRVPTRPRQLYDGEVTRIVHLADIQKVTLQVHVRLDAPDAAPRPEMLVEVHFLAAPPAAGAAADAGEALRAAVAGGAVSIPARLLVDGSKVWLIDALSGRATLRGVEVAGRDGERVLVRAGLNLSDKLIDGGRDGLGEGDPVEVASAGGGDASGGGR